ncbi:hypothetical protein ACQSED_21810 [Salmonella enterica]
MTRQQYCELHSIKFSTFRECRRIPKRSAGVMTPG